jgi:hypothetical protein
MIIRKGDILSVKVVSLSLLLIFGIITAMRAEPIKSINNGLNRETTRKMEENGIALRKKAKPAKDSDESLKKLKAKFQSGPSYTDDEGLRSSKIFDVNLLKVAEEKKKNLLPDSLDKLIYVDKVSQEGGIEKYLTFQEVNKANFSNSDFGQFVPRPRQNGTKYFGEEKTLATLKLLQSKREEIFSEIFFGFRFSFYPMSRHIFLETNVTPSSEKGPNIMIPF